MVPSGFRMIAHLCFINQLKKNDLTWPQQPFQEEYQISVKNWIFDDPFHKKGLVLFIWGARDDQIIKISNFFDEMRLLRSLRLLRLLRSLF